VDNIHFKEENMSQTDLSSEILLVDDSAFNTRYISQVITPLGYKLITAHTGQEALRLLTTGKPNLIIMDIQMPEMDGFECCEQIKKNAAYANIPVIFVTGSHDEKDKAKAMSMGAKAYLTKPINPDILISELEFNMPWA
jgi:CheY-like chemotaxis protein